jgi:hypothetical protein
MLGATPPDAATLRPGLPAAMAAAIMQCVATDPARRYQAAADVLEAWRAARAF